MAQFHERLKEAIKKANLSQRQIALKMGVAPQSIWEWVNVGYPSLERFRQLCDMLNANPAYLLGLVD